ncbi:MAG: type IV pilus assembly protein PilM [Candidatus Woesebacteria bacterium]|jgi:type IV pilus assembly protein PilM
MQTTALDVGTYSFKAIIGKAGKNPQIEKVIEEENETSIAVPNEDAQFEKLREKLSNFFSYNKIPATDLRLSLPETVTATKVILIPPLTDAELASAISWQAEQHIPIPKDDLALEYKVLYRPPKKNRNEQMRVLLVASKKSLVELYTSIFIDMGIEPKILETQALSIMRSLGFDKTDPATAIVHIGAASMSISIVNQGELSFVHSSASGGQGLSKILQQNLGLDAKQAEQYKRSYGLMPDQFQGKVRDALLPAVETLAAEIKKALRFFTNQAPQSPVQRVVLSGGTSQLPGLMEYLGQNLGIEVLLCSPFSVAKGNLPETNHQAMSVCMGLMMRES